jgi:hypothetical protein
MTRSRPIQDLATIQTGYQFRGRIEPVKEGTHHVIQPKDIDNEGRLCVEGLDRVTPKRAVDAFLVRPGDVLFLSRGYRPVAVTVTEPMEDAFVSSFFFLVRPNEKLVRPRYLAWAVNVPLRSHMATLMQGTHVPQVSIADFSELPVDLPSLDVQDQIVTVDDLARKELRLSEQLARRRADLVRMACVRASRQGQQGGNP